MDKGKKTSLLYNKKGIFTYIPIYKMNKISSIQYLRGIASFFVLLNHAHLPFIDGNFNGAIGVDFFFLVSGFIIHHSISKSDYSKKPINFLINRLTRILPTYIIMTLAFSILLVISNNSITIKFLVKSLALVSSDFNSYSPPVLYPGWTLQFEFIFYLFVFIGLLLKRVYFLLIILLCFGISGFFLNSPNIYVDLLFSPFFIYFSVGFFLYKILMSRNINQPGILLLSLSSILILVVMFRTSEYDIFIGNPHEILKLVYFKYPAPRILIWGIPSIFFFYCIFYYSKDKKTNEKLLFLGNISYSLYLIHPLVFEITNQIIPYNIHLSGYSKLVLKVTGILLSIYLAGLSRQYFEIYLSNKIKLTLQAAYLTPK